MGLYKQKAVKEITKTNKKVKEAYNLSRSAHKNQKRLSGDPYFSHLEEVANIIVSWTGSGNQTNDDLVCAALLHDITEETPIKLSQIEAQFGEKVANLVDGVSKLKSRKRKEEAWLTLQKVIKRGYLDPKVFILKLADRIHNMRTLSYMSHYKQVQKAKETRDVYAKLAKALGMWEVKIELDDLSYKHLDPKSFRKIKKEIASDKRVSGSTKNTANTLQKLLLTKNIKARIYPSINGCWAIERKMDKNLDKGISATRDIKNVNDVVSYRVLVKDVDSCYKALGIIEQYFGDKVDEERFDNYLLKPRINGYSALQTTVISPRGAIEIAITTEERESFNRMGIVSLLTKKNHINLNKYVLKVIFNQNGEIMFLPKKATGLDALYKNPRTAASAKAIFINGKKQPLSKVLPNGSVITGIYSKKVKRAPDKKLLKYALNDTKKLMLAQINLREKERLIEKGRNKMKNILIPRGILTLSDIDETAWQLVYLCNTESVYDLLLKLGKGLIKKNQIGNYLNSLGLTKKDRKYSTILLKGKNKTGVLAKVSKKIALLGGDIQSIKHTKQDKLYILRLLVTGFTKDNEKKLEKYLKKDRDFSFIQVI